MTLIAKLHHWSSSDLALNTCLFSLRQHTVLRTLVSPPWSSSTISTDEMNSSFRPKSRFKPCSVTRRPIVQEHEASGASRENCAGRRALEGDESKSHQVLTRGHGEGFIVVDRAPHRLLQVPLRLCVDLTALAHFPHEFSSDRNVVLFHVGL